MDIRDIRYFLAVYEHGNISAAAEALYISQQALSKSILKSEGFLGVQLFARNAHGVEPTDCARQLVPSARRALREYDDLVALGRQMAQSEAVQLVRMGFACGCFNQYNPVSPADIAEFGRTHPSITLSISECGPTEQITSLLEGSIDVAYMVGTPRDPQLEARLVCREPNFIIMSTHHPLASKDSLTMEDLTGCTVLIPSEFKSERLGKQNLEAAGFEGIGAKAHFFDGAFSHIVERVRMNEGLWCAGESFCQSVNPNGLVFRPHPNPQVFSEHYLAYKKEARISGALQEVLAAFAPGDQVSRGKLGIEPPRYSLDSAMRPR